MDEPQSKRGPLLRNGPLAYSRTSDQRRRRTSPSTISPSMLKIGADPPELRQVQPLSSSSSPPESVSLSLPPLVGEVADAPVAEAVAVAPVIVTSVSLPLPPVGSSVSVPLSVSVSVSVPAASSVQSAAHP